MLFCSMPVRVHRARRRDGVPSWALQLWGRGQPAGPAVSPEGGGPRGTRGTRLPAGGPCCSLRGGPGGVVPPPRPAPPCLGSRRPLLAARRSRPGVRATDSSPGPAARGGAGGPAAHGGGGGRPPRLLAPTPRRALPPHSWSFGSAHSLINPFGIIYKK